MTVEWKDDPSPLHLLECGESAFVGRWKLHIDKMKEVNMDRLLGGLLSSLSEKEEKVLRTRFDSEGNEIEIENAEPTFMEKQQMRKAWQESHPYQWRIDLQKEQPEPFAFLGGSAKTAEEGKRLAEAAVEHAEMIYKALEKKASDNAW